jgi:hypothetical protein
MRHTIVIEVPDNHVDVDVEDAVAVALAGAKLPLKIIEYHYEQMTEPSDGPLVGARVELTRDVERYPHFIASAGWQGTVVDISYQNISVQMDNYLGPGAHAWDNQIVFTPEDDFDGACRILEN